MVVFIADCSDQPAMSTEVSYESITGVDPYGPSTNTLIGLPFKAASFKRAVNPFLTLMKNTISFQSGAVERSDRLTCVDVLPWSVCSSNISKRLESELAIVNGWASNGRRETDGMVR